MVLDVSAETTQACVFSPRFTSGCFYIIDQSFVSSCRQVGSRLRRRRLVSGLQDMKTLLKQSLGFYFCRSRVVVDHQQHPIKIQKFHQTRSSASVSTVTSQQPYYWSDDVIPKAPTVQTRSGQVMLQPPVSPSAGWLNVQMRYNCTGVRTEDWLKLQGFFSTLGSV